MTAFRHIVAAALAVSIATTQLPSVSQAAGVSYCKSFARNQANRRAGAKQVLPGMVGGAVAGLLVGALVGGHHALTRGALIGGVGGTVVGGVSANKKWRSTYNRAYARCRGW